MTDSAPVAYLSQRKDGVTIKIRLSPGAKKNRINGLHGDALKVSISAPAVDGKANEALVELLSKTLQVPKSYISLIQGQTSRSKVVLVQGSQFQTIQKNLTMD